MKSIQYTGEKKLRQQKDIYNNRLRAVYLCVRTFTLIRQKRARCQISIKANNKPHDSVNEERREVKKKKESCMEGRREQEKNKYNTQLQNILQNDEHDDVFTFF